jgi:hypothetical protein
MAISTVYDYSDNIDLCQAFSLVSCRRKENKAVKIPNTLSIISSQVKLTLLSAEQGI